MSCSNSFLVSYLPWLFSEIGIFSTNDFTVSHMASSAFCKIDSFNISMKMISLIEVMHKLESFIMNNIHAHITKYAVQSGKEG